MTALSGGASQRQRTTSVLLASLVGVCGALLVWAGPAMGSPSLLYVQTPHTSATEGDRVALVARFYGLELEHLTTADATASSVIARTVEEGRSRLIVVTADSLPSLRRNEILEAVENRNPHGIGVFVLGVSDQISPSELRAWSRGAISSSSPIENEPGLIPFAVTTSAEALTAELHGQTFMSSAIGQYAFTASPDHASTAVIRVSSRGQSPPTFVRVQLGNGYILFEAKNAVRDVHARIEQEEYPNRFMGVAALMMAVKSAFADRAWHSPGKYANLTIDDPWLVEPYGLLSYSALLTEMQRARFHSTIAFIPWNFDRSEEPVSKLIREYPNQWSIAIHGNDHDHHEFYVYRRLADGAWPRQSFEKQASALRVAVARMERFQAADRIPYDRVMIFPHTIAGSMTLGLLKRYDFWATVNASNIPPDEQSAQSLEFFLRATTLKFENFPSVRRFAPDALAESDVARELFLGNPVLLYVHHDYFSGGIARFNAFAENVNRQEPGIRWTNLGEIAKHLYLERALEDGTREIRALSTNIEIMNHRSAEVIFVIRHNEASYPPIKRILVAGRERGFDRSGEDVVVTVSLDPGEVASVEIEHESDLVTASPDVAKTDMRVRLLRLGAETRDMVVARSETGRALIDWYYGRSRIPTQVLVLGVVSLGALMLIIITVRYQINRRQTFVPPRP